MTTATPVIKLDLGELPRSSRHPDVAPYTEEQMGLLVAAEAAKITQHWTKNYPDNSDLQACVRGVVADVLGILDGASLAIPGMELVPLAYENTKDHYGTVWPAVPFGGNLQGLYNRCDKQGYDKCELFVTHCATVEASILKDGLQYRKLKAK